MILSKAESDTRARLTELKCLGSGNLHFKQSLHLCKAVEVIVIILFIQHLKKNTRESSVSRDYLMKGSNNKYFHLNKEST